VMIYKRVITLLDMAGILVVAITYGYKN
jgi:hypothetical protein